MKMARLGRPVMTTGVLVFLGMALGGCASTCGRGPDAGGPPPRSAERPMPPPDRLDPAFREALQACAQEQGMALPAPGEGPPPRDGARPDRARMDACLEAKGFEHPPGPPPDVGMRRGPGGPGLPPPDPAAAAAFRACTAEQGVRLPEPGAAPAADDKPAASQLDHDKLHACMEAKGFRRPDRDTP